MSSTAVDEPVINILRVLLSALEKYIDNEKVKSLIIPINILLPQSKG